MRLLSKNQDTKDEARQFSRRITLRTEDPGVFLVFQISGLISRKCRTWSEIKLGYTTKCSHRNRLLWTSFYLVVGRVCVRISIYFVEVLNFNFKKEQKIKPPPHSVIDSNVRKWLKSKNWRIDCVTPVHPMAVGTLSLTRLPWPVFLKFLDAPIRLMVMSSWGLLIPVKALSWKSGWHQSSTTSPRRSWIKSTEAGMTERVEPAMIHWWRCCRQWWSAVQSGNSANCCISLYI